MSHSVSGKVSEFIYVRLDKDQDLMAAIKQAVRDHDIKTGVVIDVTGSFTKARFQKFVGESHDTARVEVVDFEGPMEVSGHGVIGMTGPGGFGGYREGEPYVHVHVVATSAKETVCGHLVPGCFVRSHLQASAFTIILGKIEGVSLTAAFQENPNGGKARIYHDLKPG